MSSDSNMRIAKNTILLYVRMLFTLAISLYTSRAILSILGEDDFGIYNVVGGVVVLFSFLTNAMTNSTQRFLNYNLGLNDEKKIADVFNTSMLAHFTIFGVVLILAETLGLWFVMTQLNIPAERYTASIWVYQASVVSTLINIIVIPYRASIIATERMGVFAYISIIDVLLKLAIVLILPFFRIDHLIIYSILFASLSFVSFILYWIICRRSISFTRFKFIWDKAQYKEQMVFSGWYLFGGMSAVGAKQGANILINIFYNVAVNAAVGIANQVRGAIFGFVSSFQTAFNPQIVKLYASGEKENLINLIYRSSKFSYYLLFVMILPIIVFCEDILSLWLVNVPGYAVVFTQLVLIASFTEVLSAPLWTAIGAIGEIKKYQIWVSLIIIMDLPLIYFVFKFGLSPIWAFNINIVTSIAAYIYRLLYIRKYVDYKLVDYCKSVILPCLLVTIVSTPVSIILHKFNNSSTPLVLVSIIITILFTCATIYVIGLNKAERAFFFNNFIRKIKISKSNE